MNGPSGPILVLFAVVGLTFWLTPIWLGVRAAKAKGKSPHWMWFGLHPISGWIAFIWLRYVARPGVTRPGSPSPQPVSGPAGVPAESGAVDADSEGLNDEVLFVPIKYPVLEGNPRASSRALTEKEWAVLMSGLPIDFETDGRGNVTTTRYDSAEAVSTRLAQIDATKSNEWVISVHRSWVEVENVVGLHEVRIRFFRTAKNRWQEYHHVQSD